MIFAQLWTDHLAWTRPVLSGSVLLIYLQMGMGAVSPIASLFRIVRRKNKGETALLCLVPFCLILTFAIVEPLFFGSFLGEGFDRVEALRAFLEQPAFFREALTLCGIFSVLAGLYLLTDWRAGRLTPFGVLTSAGVETLFVLAVLLLGVDFLWGEGRLFHNMGDTLLKWFIYGLYLLLSKACLYGVCLVWWLLFREREWKTEPDSPAGYGLWLRRYLTGSYRSIGWSLVMFFAFFYAVVVLALEREGGESASVAAVLFYLDAAMMGVGLGFLLLSYFPRMMPNYRRLLRWEDPDFTLRQLYRELTQEKPLYQSGSALVTQHYLVLLFPYKRIFYRPLLERAELLPTGVYRLRFRDGNCCRINRGDPQLLQALNGPGVEGETSGGEKRAMVYNPFQK